MERKQPLVSFDLNESNVKSFQRASLNEKDTQMINHYLYSVKRLVSQIFLIEERHSIKKTKNEKIAFLTETLNQIFDLNTSFLKERHSSCLNLNNRYAEIQNEIEDLLFNEKEEMEMFFSI